MGSFWFQAFSDLVYEVCLLATLWKLLQVFWDTVFKAVEQWIQNQEQGMEEEVDEDEWHDAQQILDPIEEDEGFFEEIPPVAKSAWKKVLPAKKVSPECLQYNPFRGFRVTGNEDCLYLNIYTPKVYFEGEEKKLPVIVWIHGGFYNFGSGGEYGPAYLLEKNVVLVTINYRLGVLGFLSTGDKSAPGNNGLRDQAMAIKWVADNIGSFGGDKNRITVVGFSAGGSSVHFHMLTNRTRNYFQQAISMSGTAFNPWALIPVQEVQKATRQMADIFQCPTRPSQAMVDCLRRQSSASLVARQSALFPKWPYPYVLFGPVVDAFEGNADPIIPLSPEDAYKSKAVHNITWIATMTKQEGHFALLFPTLMGRMTTLRRHWKNIAPLLLVYEKETDKVAEVTDKITDYYFKGVDPLVASLDTFSEMYTDRHFGNSLHKALQYHSKIAPTYSYVFDFMGKYNLGNLIGQRQHEWGVGHAEDTFYLFNSSSSYAGFKKSDPELKLSSIMVNVICNFVRTGKPTYTTENATTWDIWERIEDPDAMSFLQLATDIKMVPEPHQNRIKFWEGLNLTSVIPSKIRSL
ncbi:unnamed protein product [Allacma fusca]|uniref:Carboxylic ester hydrolase n=1 Tax=Allacma fusca TaxID=39272 RepID=A0A8J2PHB8_9HEXA|nr:unnamed protein product [Allacma fusca]